MPYHVYRFELLVSNASRPSLFLAWPAISSNGFAAISSLLILLRGMTARVLWRHGIANTMDDGAEADARALAGGRLEQMTHATLHGQVENTVPEWYTLFHVPVAKRVGGCLEVCEGRRSSKMALCIMFVYRLSLRRRSWPLLQWIDRCWLRREQELVRGA